VWPWIKECIIEARKKDQKCFLATKKILHACFTGHTHTLEPDRILGFLRFAFDAGCLAPKEMEGAFIHFKQQVSRHFEFSI